LVVRVLNERGSLEACRFAGVAEEFIVMGRGPFSVEENRTVIRKFKIGVLVTKDSGIAGGLPDKIEAARMEKCQVVVVQRPDQELSGTFGNFADLLAALQAKVPVENRLTPTPNPELRMIGGGKIEKIYPHLNLIADSYHRR
jgi:precorrin-6A/cobalt-precorrin-6A reductase